MSALRGNEQKAIDAAIGEYRRRGCNAARTAWSFQDQHRWAAAHLRACQKKNMTELDDYGVYAHQLPSKGKDGEPAQMPEFVIAYEKSLQSQAGSDGNAAAQEE